MCGILGMQVTDNTKTKEITEKAYNIQKNRGRKGFGIGFITPNDKLERARSTKEDQIFESPIFDEKDGYLIFHHRQPTSTPNIVRCNHPFFNEDKTILLIHNGVITEDSAKKLLTDKHEFESQVYLSYLDEENIIVSPKKRLRTDTEYALHFYEEARRTMDWAKALKSMANEPAFSHSTFLILEKGIKGILFLSTGNALKVTDYNGTKVLNSDGYELCDTIGILQDNAVKVVERLPVLWKQSMLYDDYGLGAVVYGNSGFYRIHRDETGWKTTPISEEPKKVDVLPAFKPPLKKYKFFLDVPEVFYAPTELEARFQLREYFRKECTKAEMMADSYQVTEEEKKDNNNTTCSS